MARLPVLLVTALILKLTRPGPVLNKKTAVRLPSASEIPPWKTFRLWTFERATTEGRAGGGKSPIGHLLLCFLPGLVNVLKGDLFLAGLAPRDAAEVEALPRDWKSLYLGSKAGLVTEAFVMLGTGLSEDEYYSAEAFYSFAAGFRHDCKLVLRYFWKVLNPFRR